MFAISMFRWISGLRRTLAVRRTPSPLHERPTEEIAPDALASYLNQVAEEDAPEEEEARQS